jgi:hypothetical protein|tara:strand:- start:285 stop:716 length:432 start_codon:yes stop_codon:yes gene_type:complete
MTWRQLPAIWQLKDLLPTDKLVLLALAQHGDSAGRNAYPAQSTLAGYCNVTARTVRRSLRTLIDKGIITPSGKGRIGTIRYTINLEISTATPKRSRSSASAGLGSERPTIQSMNPDKKERGVMIDRFSSNVILDSLERTKDVH